MRPSSATSSDPARVALPRNASGDQATAAEPLGLPWNDVWLSGMALDQGGGLRAYRLHAGRHSTSVDVFAAPRDRLATVADQRAAAESALSAPRWVDEDSSASATPAALSEPEDRRGR